MCNVHDTSGQVNNVEFSTESRNEHHSKPNTEHSTNSNIFDGVYAVPDDVTIDVIDDGPGPGHSHRPSGSRLGLENVRRRLEVAYGAEASLDLTPAPNGRGCCARLRLPQKLAVGDLEVS